jgi:hypothetical protein
MQQVLRPYAFTGIAIVGAGLIGVTPVTPPLPDVQFHAVQLSAAADPFADIGNLFSDLIGAGSSGTGGLSDITADFTGLFDGLGLGDAGTAAAADPSSLLTPYIDLFTNSFNNLDIIGSKFLGDPLPFVQEIFANPSLIADLPSAIFSTLSDPATITTNLADSPLTLPITIGIMLGAPLVIGLGEAGPLATSAEAFQTYFGELGSGNPTTVLTALIDGPANIANAFLNGSAGLDVLGINLPLLNGILVPDTNLDIPVDVNVQTLLTDLLGSGTATEIIDALEGIFPVPTDLDVANITVGPFGGLADGLINYVPQQIAAALTDSSTSSALDSTTQLTGNLGSLLDPSTLVGDLTTLLTGSTADLPAGLAADLVPNLAGMLLDPMTLLPF